MMKVLLLAFPDDARVQQLSAAEQAELVDEWMAHHAVGLAQNQGPAIEVRESPACGGSRGVFAVHAIPRGKLVCLYPGLVSLPHQFAARLKTDKLRNTKRCTVLYDGTVLDPDALSPPCTVTSAVAHRCHHPPKGLLPNVIKASFFWPSSFVDNPVNKIDSQDLAMMRDLSFTDAKGDRVRGLGYVTVRDVLAGEELFVNYRLNPMAKQQWPAWYVPVDEVEDRQRWDTFDDVGDSVLRATKSTK